MNLKQLPYSSEEAVVLEGHGTDHPAWTAYFALKSVLSQFCKHIVYVGMIEGYPSNSRVIRSLYL